MKHEKTFEAITKLKDIETELHRLKNALELANKALDSAVAAEREACAKVCDEIAKLPNDLMSDAPHIAAAIRARKENT